MQSAQEPRERRHVDRDGSSQENAGQSVRIELEGAGAGIRAADNPCAVVAFVAQHDALHRDRVIAERAGNADVLAGNEQAGVEE